MAHYSTRIYRVSEGPGSVAVLMWGQQPSAVRLREARRFLRHGRQTETSTRVPSPGPHALYLAANLCPSGAISASSWSQTPRQVHGLC